MGVFSSDLASAPSLTDAERAADAGRRRVGHRGLWGDKHPGINCAFESSWMTTLVTDEGERRMVVETEIDSFRRDDRTTCRVQLVLKDATESGGRAPLKVVLTSRPAESERAPHRFAEGFHLLLMCIQRFLETREPTNCSLCVDISAGNGSKSDFIESAIILIDVLSDGHVGAILRIKGCEVALPGYGPKKVVLLDTLHLPSIERLVALSEMNPSRYVGNFTARLRTTKP